MERRSAAWRIVYVCLIGVVGSLGMVGHASADPSKIATSLGDLRWGMSESDVITFVKRKIADKFDEASAHASESKKSRLRDEMKSAQSAVSKSLVKFDGRSSRWNSSPIAGEFVDGNDESMVVYDDGTSQNYYFFVGGHLWKWYKTFDKGSFGGAFKKFASSIEKKFGKGHAKSGEMAKGQGDTQWIEYIDRNSRMRAADNGRHGVYALVFEEMATVRELASTHGPSKPSRNEYRDDEGGSDDQSPSGGTEIAKANTNTNAKRSIFADEQHAETDAEYQARVKKLAAQDRAAQQRMHERKQDAKRGEALKPLEGVDDKDPLGGL